MLLAVLIGRRRRRRDGIQPPISTIANPKLPVVKRVWPPALLTSLLYHPWNRCPNVGSRLPVNLSLGRTHPQSDVMASQNNRSAPRSIEEEPPISPNDESSNRRHQPEVRLSLDQGVVRPGDRDSDAQSTGSSRFAAFRRRGKRMTASTSYQHPKKVIGAEPGISASQEIDMDLYERCGITTVDFGPEDMVTTELINETLPEFLERPRPRWATVRWINVNGLSWDVIKCLGQYKGLHRLAIEDIMNPQSRTKADWYSDHALIVLTLQKLVELDGVENDTGKKKKRGWFKRFFDVPDSGFDSDDDEIPDVRGHTEGGEPMVIQTLQRYHGGPNVEGILYMERNSSLAQKQLAVSVEQCSIFLCDDNTVISFFERSADDIEPPIMARLASTNTLLRNSCDGSMIVQAIIDTIVDLCFPVIRAYQDTIGDLELSVLTDTSLHDTQRLYILTSELALLKTTIQPLTGLINALRDHKRDESRRKDSKLDALTTVGISSVAYTYLGDVSDHTIMLLETVETMKRSADNLTDYIFNLVGNLQNESMQQLTIVTIFFLPLTFLTGYFGMNFEEFSGIKRSDAFFWYLAVPIAIATMFILLNGQVVRLITKLFRKRHIRRTRALRVKHERRLRTQIKLNAARRFTFGGDTSMDEKRALRSANGGLEVLEEMPSGSGTADVEADDGSTGSNRITIEP
ncbi:hypothetical protein Dda_2711 [Drechslerella dactyloides]|uniref:Uncharacterized protein n=1 Tax=Drechslerella dactyloides TaxID=74499 RepID=A0AAD6J4D9_DREDA|nr:hypothetical protein Dda_2711 [Drechslerella dactyloides]